MDERGVVITIVVISLLMMTMIAGFAALLAYNQNRLLGAITGRRILSYYRSQAGVVDAIWRIRSNFTTGLSAVAGTVNFNDPTFDPAIYGLDIDVNPPQIKNLGVPAEAALADVRVDIGAVGANGSRPIEATGIDTT